MNIICAARGRIGSRIIDALCQKGQGSNTIAGVRRVNDTDELKSKGIELRQVEYNDPEGLIQAFQGVERVVFLPSYDDAEDRAKQGINAIRAAETAGVSQFIFIGIMDTRLDSPLTFAQAYGAMEQALISSTLEWTILRTSMYTDNLAEQFPVWLERKELVTAAGDGKISYVSRDDISASIVGVLADPIANHASKTYTLTGPEAYSYEDICKIICELFNTKITMNHISVEEFEHDIKEKWGLAYEGKHNHVIRATPYFQLVFSQGYMEEVTDHVQMLSGHKPESVVDWLQRNVPEINPE